MFASLQSLAARIGFWQTAKFSENPFFAQAFTHAHAVEQVCYYTDRQTVSPLTELAQTFIRTYIHDNKTVNQILSIWLFKFLSYSVRMTSNIQTDRLPVDGFCPKVDRNLQIMFKDHIPNFIPVALIVFELSCSQTDIIPKLCFSDSGRSKTWRFVKISSSNFLTITIRIRESKNGTFHIQGFVVFKERKRITQLKPMNNNCHREVMKGSMKQNAVYCSKAGTKVSDFYSNNLNKNEEVNALEKLQNDCHDCDNLFDIYKYNFKLSCRFHTFIQKHHGLKQQLSDHVTECFVIVGPTGTGKTGPIRHNYDINDLYWKPHGQSLPSRGIDSPMGGGTVWFSLVRLIPYFSGVATNFAAWGELATRLSFFSCDIRHKNIFADRL
ncbi:hypothetical protein AVEN_242156-1 [Araneus ventricosus]|uniref:CRESS-DNA virus Rep endonuclease domain-containing protein n=1 Tax=Araneus ventricosus TaxID=182803 RepID=A0A4Y2DFU7_ARAVE|nr:hypothetical protein AVEN_242156-1 [Araneus ventricosus]